VTRSRLLSNGFLSALLLSRGRPRLVRHLLFWGLYGSYFYLQGISPDCVKGLDRSEVLYYAFTSLVCFLPACVGCVYATLYLLDPVFLKEKRYWGFIGGSMVLFGLAVGVNYFFSLLFFRLSCHCVVAEIPAIRVFALGFLNSQNALIAGGVALGAKLAAGAYYQKKENLQLMQRRCRTPIAAQKTKAQPDYLLCQLASIATQIRVGATDPPTMILQLSNLLRYWLYDGTEETILLEEECAILHQFLRLENARRCPPRAEDLWIEGNIRNVPVAPMILLPLLQAAAHRCQEDRHGGPLIFLQLRIVLKGSTLSFRLDRAYPASGDAFFEASEPVRHAIERLERFYPGRHTLEIKEIQEATSHENTRRLLHLSLDLDVSFTPPVPRRQSLTSSTNVKAYEPS